LRGASYAGWVAGVVINPIGVESVGHYPASVVCTGMINPGGVEGFVGAVTQGNLAELANPGLKDAIPLGLRTRHQSAGSPPICLATSSKIASYLR